MTTPPPTSNISSITRGVETMNLDRREYLRRELEKANKVLTFGAMVAASPLDDIPRCYFPDRDLNHFPPTWFLGFAVTMDDVWSFSQIHNLVPSCAAPSKSERMNARNVVEQYLGDTFYFTRRYKSKIEFVHNNTKTSVFCVSLCCNYTYHLYPDPKLEEMEDHMLKLWDFIKPTIAWYLNAAATPSHGELMEWPLDFDFVWETKYVAKSRSFRSAPSIVPA